jgi:hypothetical protein
MLAKLYWLSRNRGSGAEQRKERDLVENIKIGARGLCCLLRWMVVEIRAVC